MSETHLLLPSREDFGKFSEGRVGFPIIETKYQHIVGFVPEPMETLWRIPRALYREFEETIESLKPSKRCKRFSFEGHRLDPEASLYVLGMIYRMSMENPKHNASDWIPLNWRYLRNIIGDGYRKTLDFLVEYGFIQERREYIPKIKCRSYAFRALTDVSNPYRYFPKGLRILSKIRLMQESLGSNHWDQDLIESLESDARKLSIDDASLQGLISREKPAIVPGTRAYQLEMAKLNRIRGFSEGTSPDFLSQDRHKRIHSPVANMKKEIRRECLRIDGKMTGSVDVKASQPALLTFIFRHYIDWLGDRAHGNPCPEYPWMRSPIPGIAPESFRHGYDSIPLDFPESWKENPEESTIKAGFELDRMARIFDSDYYDWFTAELNKLPDFWYRDRKSGRGKTREKKTYTRSMTKRAWLQHAYATPRAVKSTDMARVWRNSFPMLTALLNHMKSRHHASLAHLMQGIEAEIVFSLVHPKVKAIGAPVITIHDCIFTSVEFLGPVKVIFDGILTGLKIPTRTEID